MYKYFIGRRNNYKERKEEEPLVIEADELASIELNQWLDNYRLDLDFFIDRIKIVLKSEIIKIYYESSKNIIFYLENQKIAFVNLKSDFLPRCKICIDNDEFVLCFMGDNVIEKCFEEENKIRYGADFTQITQEISLGNNREYISIKFEDEQGDIYNTIKKNINLLKRWNNIKEILKWLCSLDTNLSTFVLCLSSVDENGLKLIRLDVEYNKLIKYTIVDSKDEYWVELDGSWYAKCDEVIFKYEAENRKKTIFISSNIIYNFSKIEEFVDSVNEYIEKMLRMVKDLNDLLIKLA